MDVPAPHKRVRISTGPRRRTGCLPCKKAHVKCSETRPACDRCVRSSADCIYPTPAVPLQHRRKRDSSRLLFREPLTPASTALVPASPSLTLVSPTVRNLDSIGYHVLRFFHQRTLPTISHYFPATFWTYALLQISESNPAIQCCILALGSWHLTVDTHGNASTLAMSPSNNDVFRYSVENYDKAISNLAKDITVRTPASSPVEVATSASVLLAIYSSLRGDRAQLTTHVRLGLNLARQSAAANSLASIVEFNRRQLSLLRLGEEMREPIFDSISIEDTLADVLTESVSEFPSGATSIDVLAADAQNMCNAVYRFARKCNTGTYTATDSAVVNEHRRLEQQCMHLRSRTTDACFPGTDMPEVKILRARLELSWIMLQAGWTLMQTSFDLYEHNFAVIVRLADEVLRPTKVCQQRLPFSVNLGLIPLLFYVSRLCREPTLRRNAVDLLEKCPAIEGMWDAREAAAVARFVIALEEDCGDGGIVSERNRIHSLRFGKSMTGDNVSSTTDLLDVTIIKQPEARISVPQDTTYRIHKDTWASGRGELCNALKFSSESCKSTSLGCYREESGSNAPQRNRESPKCFGL